jgi:putative Mn2+ efflux pump MntP
MINGTIKQETSAILLNIAGFFLFGFTVSIDSFSAGIGIKLISDNYLLCSVIFSLTSAIFTYSGLKIGGFISSKYKEYSKIIGGIILITFALKHLFS